MVVFSAKSRRPFSFQTRVINNVFLQRHEPEDTKKFYINHYHSSSTDFDKNLAVIVKELLYLLLFPVTQVLLRRTDSPEPQLYFSE
jgi:hypothetical protein